jgi:hypothetical protein
MATHLPGIVVEIWEIKKGNCGRSCKEHNVCGKVVEEETLVHLRKVQMMVGGKEVLAIAAIWVTDKVDCCHVSFLGHHLVVHVNHYDGGLVQVMKVLSLDPGHCDLAERCLYHKNHGCALTIIVSCLFGVKKSG